MKLLQQQYIDHRLQKHLEGLKLPQGGRKMELRDLLAALEATGAMQPQEAPEEENVWRWPFEGKDGVVFLSHCNLRSRLPIIFQAILHIADYQCNKILNFSIYCQ